MKLSLRKAHVLIKNLERKIGVYRSTSITVPYGSSMDETKKLANIIWEKNKKGLETRLAIVDIMYTLRAAINELNQNERLDGKTINELVQAKVRIEEQMKFLADFAEKTNAPHDINRIERAERIVRRDKDKYEQNASIDGFSTETFNEMNAKYVELKKEQLSIIDGLAVRNNLFEVELHEDWIPVLNELQVLL